MRLTLISLFLVLATNGASANDVLSAQDRTTVVANLDRNCYAEHLAQAMQDAAASGQAIAPELLDAKTIPVETMRAKMKQAPASARFDQQLVAGCNCMMKKWKKMARASRTWADVKAMNAAMVTSGVTPEATAESKACIAKAQAD